jgi:hypothetical protein
MVIYPHLDLWRIRLAFHPSFSFWGITGTSYLLPLFPDDGTIVRWLASAASSFRDFAIS